MDNALLGIGIDTSLLRTCTCTSHLFGVLSLARLASFVSDVATFIFCPLYLVNQNIDMIRSWS